MGRAQQAVVTGTDQPVADADSAIPAPKTGVEIVAVEEREGVQYFTVRDLRNGNMVKNVTETSARRLWHYAITQYLETSEGCAKSSFVLGRGIGIASNARQRKEPALRPHAIREWFHTSILMALLKMGSMGIGRSWWVRSLSNSCGWVF